METNRSRLKDFLTFVDEDMLVEVIYHHLSECVFTAKELFDKRPEVENTYVKPKGIGICTGELDRILANNSEERKAEYFRDIMQNEYAYLVIEVED